MTKYIFILCVSLAIIFGCVACANADSDTSSASTDIIHVNAAEAKTRLDADKAIQILDIRTPEEFHAGHMDGAILINYYADDFAEQVSRLDKTTPYLVHCRSGGRSGRALTIFKDQGFETIYHLDGGYLAWESLPH